MDDKNLYDEWIDEKGIKRRTKKLLINGKPIDFNDWSWTVKHKFDSIDVNRVNQIKNQVGFMGKAKKKFERASLGSRDLRRWGYDA